MKDVLLSWHGSFVGRLKRKVWYAAPFCLFWIVWREWNRRAFENKETLVHGIKMNFLYNHWAWTLVFWFQGPSSIVDFVDWLRLKCGSPVILSAGAFCCPC